MNLKIIVKEATYYMFSFIENATEAKVTERSLVTWRGRHRKGGLG